MTDGSAVRAADLVAAAVGRAVDDTGSAAAAVACYPAWWTQHTVEAQRAALAAAGLDGVALVPEPTAAMRWLQEVHESGHDGAMVVYDLGATGLTISIVRTGTFSGLLGEPLRDTTVAGAEFDLLTMRYVLAYAVGDRDFDPFDPLVEQELSALRVRCRNAKEILSKETATMVPVCLPEIGPVDVRLVRDEVEDLFRAPLLTSLALVCEAVRRAGLSITDLDGILLTGGSTAIPLVTEMLSTEFGIPVAAAADPAHLSAHGAALLAGDLLTDITPTEPQAALSAPLPDTRPAGREPHPAAVRAARLRNHPVGTARDHGEHGASSTGQHVAHAENYDARAEYEPARDVTEPPRIAREPARTEYEPPNHRATADENRAPAATSTGPHTIEPVRPIPALPATEPPAGGFTHWRRVAVASAVAVAVAALATGTLAMGTGVQSAPADPTVPQPASTTAAALDTPEAATPTGGRAAPVGHPVTTTAARAGTPGATTAADGLPAADPAAPPGTTEAPATQQVPVNQPVNPHLPSLQPPTLPTVPPLDTEPLIAVPSVPGAMFPHTGG
ncbi:Hsp70 family protein [Nocardia sp. NPDC057668]|uniref:Hsp70 family protein n=1 Tax=Nocardia sp. NPDC057668 TaxID=3346202 RepID=UPI00366AAD73